MSKKRDHNYFDGFARSRKMIPTGSVEAKHGKILLADSGEIIIEDGRMFWRTGWAIMREGKGLGLGNFGEYEIGEPGGSSSEQKFRLEDATMHAQTIMAQLADTGYFDDDRKHDFSQ